MNWDVRFSKEMIAKAKARGKALFVIGFHCMGRAEAFMYLDEEHATFLWWLAHELSKGVDRAEAVAIVEARLTKCKAEQATKEAES